MVWRVKLEIYSERFKNSVSLKIPFFKGIFCVHFHLQFWIHFSQNYSSLYFRKIENWPFSCLKVGFCSILGILSEILPPGILLLSVYVSKFSTPFSRQFTHSWIYRVQKTHFVCGLTFSLISFHTLGPYAHKYQLCGFLNAPSCTLKRSPLVLFFVQRRLNPRPTRWIRFYMHMPWLITIFSPPRNEKPHIIHFNRLRISVILIERKFTARTHPAARQQIDN